MSDWKDEFDAAYELLKEQSKDLPTSASWGFTGAVVGTMTAGFAGTLGLAIAYRWNPWIVAGLVVLTLYGIGRCRRAPMGAYRSAVAHTAVEATERMLTIFGLIEKAQEEEA